VTIDPGAEDIMTEQTSVIAAAQSGPVADGLTRWVPRLLLMTAGLHLVVGAVLYRHELAGIAGDGFVNTIVDAHRDAAFWFMVSGVALTMIADTARHAVNRTGRFPLDVGWWLIGLGLLIVVIMPVSGGWFVLVVGALGVRAARTRPR
jgi:hypothetical protein